MSYEINVLVNGNRCKQYSHAGKLFIEAKHGSEYSIELKNNTWSRILAVCSVDGLDILNGKPASEDGPGYVIGSLNSSKFDGFRVSDETVAKFVFSCKDSSYAKSKEDGSEKNVGVIGIRLFGEKKFIPTPPPKEIHHHHYHNNYDHWIYGDTINYPPYNPPTIWCEDHTMIPTSLNLGGLGAIRNISENSIPSLKDASYCCDISHMERKLSNNATKLSTSGLSNTVSTNCLRGFDMGTKWGEAKESKVVEVEFERGSIVLNTNIYYASRQSLLEMGVPLGNEKQVSFPEPFVNSKYATPPKNWKG